MAETVIANVEAAQAALAEGEDEAREIVADADAGPKPRRMAEALLAAGDELVVAMSLLCTGGDDSVGTVVEHLETALEALEDVHDEAEAHLAGGGGARGAAVAEALLAAEGPTQAAAELVGEPGGVAPDVPDEGDVIELADGEYAMDALAAEGATYRAEHALKAVITKRCKLAGGVTADGLAFTHGLEVAPGGTAIGCKVECRSDASPCLDLQGEDSVAYWCEVTNYEHRGVEMAKRTQLRHSWVHGQRPGAASITDSTANVMIGGFKADQPESQEMMGAVVADSLVEENTWRCAIEIKGCGNRVERCTAIGAEKVADMYVRHGTDNVFEGCYLHDGGLQLGDERNQAICCETAGGRSDGLGFKRGGVTGDEMREGAEGYPIAEDCQGIAHVGEIDTDWSNGSGEDWADKPKGTKLARVEKSKIVGDGAYEIDESIAPDPLPPAARKLSRDEVGPAARVAAVGARA